MVRAYPRRIQLPPAGSREQPCIDFVNKVPKAGRTEVLRQGNWDLTIIGPEQYRDGK